jgi:hypothetical protein
MSLLRRTLPDSSSSSSLAQTSTNGTPPTPPARPPSPFGPRPTTPPPPPSRLPQPAVPAVQYSVIPTGATLIRFQLKGLGDPFHRMLGETLNMDYGTPQKAAEALQKDESLRERVTALLDKTWANYQMVGAMLLTPYDLAMRVYTSPVHPVPLPDDDSLETPAAPVPPKCEFVRAIDLTLVLNVLARVRDGILVAETPLALEPAFLDKTWVTSEARLVALARATGCLEDVWA